MVWFIDCSIWVCVWSFWVNKVVIWVYIWLICLNNLTILVGVYSSWVYVLGIWGLNKGFYL